VSGVLVARTPGADPVEHNPGQAAALPDAVFVWCDTPEVAHEQQHVGGIKVRADAVVGDAGVQQLRHGDDGGIGLVDGVLNRGVVQGFPETVLDPAAAYPPGVTRPDL
jgi:hypothetical protein